MTLLYSQYTRQCSASSHAENKILYNYLSECIVEVKDHNTTISMMAMKRPGTSSEEGRVKVPRLEDSSMCGVIQNIVLTNFMCHGSFEWSPNTNVNFVTGVNGSGKSSILQGTYCHTILQSNQYNPVSSKFMLHIIAHHYYFLIFLNVRIGIGSPG